MAHKFAEIAFTKTVRDMQVAEGSRAGYASMDDGEDFNHVINSRESQFIAARDSFYMASVSETDWPYVQHRGGPAGFLRVIDEKTLGFADFSGNRQYVSAGNFRKNDRVALFLMDYPNKRRLKILGRVRAVEYEETELFNQLSIDGYPANVERGFLIQVEAFDWNCPQHITPRYTEPQIDELIAPALKATLEEELLFKAGADIFHHSRELGDGPLDLVVSGVRQLTTRVRAYELRDPNGADLPAVKAGSHLEVPVQLEHGKQAIRHYSICSNPARRDVYEIAVLRETGGEGGSRSVHDLFELGLRLRCSMPQNHFSLHDDDKPTVLIAGGIGITPIKAMAQTLQARGNSMELHYAGHSEQEMAFRDRLVREFGEAIRVYRSSHDERMDLNSILASAPKDSIFYVCGPSRLIDGVMGAAKSLNIDTSRIVFERFSAAVQPDEKPIYVSLKRSGKTLDVAADQTILDAMLEAGVDAPFSCRAGNCKSCAVKVVDGKPDHRDSALSEKERVQGQLMCLCVSRAKSASLVLDI